MWGDIIVGMALMLVIEFFIVIGVYIFFGGGRDE